MAYQSNKPLANDKLNISQGDLLGNFTAIGNLLAPNEGYVKFPRTVAIPATAATTVGLYGADSAEDPGNTALWFLPQAGDPPIDFTTALFEDRGWARLPSGILLKWGNLQTTATTATYTFPVTSIAPGLHPIPAFTVAPLFIGIMPYSSAGDGHSFWITGKTALNFSLRFHTGVNIYWFALGY